MQAPIALFVFRRPEETKMTLEAIAQNDGINESELYIYCDAPRRATDEAAVSATRTIAKGRKWCPRTHIIERTSNMGLANSIIDGVTQLTRSHGKAIVIEDDLLTAKGFLPYMNHALERYERYDNVMQISGHMSLTPPANADQDSIFLPLTTSWGWATWDRAWSHFDPHATGWQRLNTDTELRHRFDLGDAYPFSDMLRRQMSGQIDSWAIRWWWSCFIRDALTLFPRTSLVSNVGFGNSATHTTDSASRPPDNHWNRENRVTTFPAHPVLAAEAWSQYLRQLQSNRDTLFKRILRKAKNTLRQMRK
jgi:hypothetical protein